MMSPNFCGLAGGSGAVNPFHAGKVGFYFAFFQALWFRMLVDAKVYEKQGNR